MDDWVFDLGEPKKPKLATDKELLAILGEPDRWEQYQDTKTYELDSLVRDWIAACSKNSSWKTNYKKRRYTMSMIFEQIFGRPFNAKAGSDDYKISRKLAYILRYYSSKIQKAGSINNRHYNKTIYTISPKRLSKPPYSLKLRLEWFAENSIMPTYTNMCLPKDTLKVGHARNPNTERNMQQRSRRAKDRYNERYNRDN